MMGETQTVLEPFWLGFAASGLFVGLWADGWGRNGIFLGLVAFCLPPVGLLTVLFLGPSEAWKQNRKPLVDRLAAWCEEREGQTGGGSRAPSEDESPRRKVRRWAWYLLAAIVFKIVSNAYGYSATAGLIYLVTVVIVLILVIGFW